MRKDKLLRRVEEYLAKPSEDDLRKLISSLRAKLVPPCPKCGSTSTVRYGFHTRKAGKVQQYRCNTCRCVYTDATADRKRGMEAHPTCPRCGSRTMKRGFWRWTRKDGTKMSEQRYQCTNPKCRHYFKKRDKENRLDCIRDYSRCGVSLRDAGNKLQMSGGGFLKLIYRCSMKLQEIDVFRLFNVQLQPIVCMDATSSGSLCYSTAKDPYTKVIVGWNVLGVESFLSAYSLEKMVVRNGINPKIWVSDGKEGYPNGLIAIYEDPDIHCTPNKPVIYSGDLLRTIYLARKPSPKGISEWVESHTYEIKEDGACLVAYKGLVNPAETLVMDDERHFTTAIQMVLTLFKDYDAQIVCLPKEKIIRFRDFATRFLTATENDGKVYHFIGTGTVGNPWAESSAKMLKRRYRWFDHNNRSAYSAARRLNVQRMVYNIFSPVKIRDSTWLSPFNYAGADYEDYDGAWDRLQYNF